MGITVAVRVEHLRTASAPVASPAGDKFRTILVPNLDYYGSVRATLNAFIRQNLFIPEDLQLLSAPLFTRLSEKDNVEDIYKRYSCQADLEVSELHLDEDTFAMFGREGGRLVDLVDEKRVEEYHILDRTTLHLKRLPSPLPESGGRVFVETKDGLLPLLGVAPSTPVAGIKHLLEGLTGIPAAQQLLSSVGRVMHDDFLIEDFDGLHTVYEDSIIDLCKSEDKNSDQAHRRMVVFVNVMGEEEFTLVVQGRDSVLSLLKLVESRTGIAPWQQRITYSGKVLQEKKTLGGYLVQPQSTLNVTMFKSPIKPSARSNSAPENKEGTLELASGKSNARKLKLMRTSKGHVKGTLTIPVLTTDTVSDLKRKLKRTLQPLVERNLPASDQNHINVTPKPFGDTIIKTPVKTPTGTHSSDRCDSVERDRTTSERRPGSGERVTGERRPLSFESKNAGGRSLSFSKLMNRSPSTQSPQKPPLSSDSQATHRPVLHTPQHLPVEGSFSPRGAKSGPLPSRTALDDLSGPTGPSSARRLRFDSTALAPSHERSASDLSQSACRDLMPELLSLPDPDPRENHTRENHIRETHRREIRIRENHSRVIVQEKPNDENNFQDENTTSGRFGSVQSNIDKKLGAIKNIDKKAVKQWFNTGMDSLKEQLRVLNNSD